MQIKVLHIIKSLGRGGAEMLLPETLKVHNKSDFEFHYLYFLPWKNQMVESLQEAGGKVICFQANNNLELLLKANRVARYVKENGFQLIHAHLPWAGLVARVVGRMIGLPVIYTEHNKQERYHFATRFLNLQTMSWLVKLIAVSKDVEESIHNFKPSLSTPIQVILNGVNLDKFTPTAIREDGIRATLNIPKNSLIIGTIAVFRFQKRLVEWMTVAAMVKKRIPEAHFIIVGDGPLKRELYKARRQLNMEQCIHFPGVQTEVRPYLRAFDVYMMSSIFEGLPIALLEAMSMGLPVVSTKAGGIAEVVRHDKEGYLVEVDEWSRLSEWAIALLRNTEKRKKFGLAARQRIKESFSMERMVQELEETYRQICVAAAK